MGRIVEVQGIDNEERGNEGEGRSLNPPLRSLDQAPGRFLGYFRLAGYTARALKADLRVR